MDARLVMSLRHDTRASMSPAFHSSAAQLTTARSPIDSKVMERRMTYRRRSIVLAAIVAAAAVGAAAARAFHVVRDIEVTFAPVTRGTIARTIVATGTLEPVETVQVGAQISGTIEALYADYNTVVHRGQILATLETAQLDAELHAAEAALGGAQAGSIKRRPRATGSRPPLSTRGRS
jgi:multidrug efflux pump subunit AcrA (membrane-fusion protein)